MNTHLIAKHDLVQNIYTGRVGVVWEVTADYIVQREPLQNIRSIEEGK